MIRYIWTETTENFSSCGIFVVNVHSSTQKFIHTSFSMFIRTRYKLLFLNLLLLPRSPLLRNLVVLPLEVSKSQPWKWKAKGDEECAKQSALLNRVFDCRKRSSDWHLTANESSSRGRLCTDINTRPRRKPRNWCLLAPPQTTSAALKQMPS